MRGSDPDAAVYWLARMVHGGEDPKFIARRMLIFASEDIGNADPQALLVAHAAFKAAEFDRLAGVPHQPGAGGDLHGARAEEQRRVPRDRRRARRGPRRARARQVPDHLRDRHRPGADDVPGVPVPARRTRSGWVEQRYLPDGLDDGRVLPPRPARLGGRARARRARTAEDPPAERCERRAASRSAAVWYTRRRVGAAASGGGRGASSRCSSIVLTVVLIALAGSASYALVGARADAALRRASSPTTSTRGCRR